MMNKNIMKMFLFISLIVILIGIVDATDINADETYSTENIMNNELTTKTTTDNNEINTETEIITDNKKLNDKESIKKIENNKTKEASTTPTKITINNLATTQYTDYTSISGKYTDTYGNSLRYTNLIVNINGNKYVTKTDNNGQYNYNYKTNKVGTNTLTISYPGNTRYTGATATKTFTVTSKATTVTINSMATTQYTDTAIISGRYTDNSGNALRYTTLTLNINANKYYTKTDNNGYYTYNYKTNKVGTNTLTISYHGTQDIQEQPQQNIHSNKQSNNSNNKLHQHLITQGKQPLTESNNSNNKLHRNSQIF